MVVIIIVRCGYKPAYNVWGSHIIRSDIILEFQSVPKSLNPEKKNRAIRC